MSSDQDMTKEELAEMPSCNLAEYNYNTWLQQSGKKGNDLFVAAVDDLVRAFMQVVAYFQFLKGERAGTGPGKEELRLLVAQRSTCRSGNPKPLQDALAHMPGADSFCTREPHLEGEEVFVSLKRKPDLPPGSEFDSHRPDKISVSRPRRRPEFSDAFVHDLTTDSSSPKDSQVPLTQRTSTRSRTGIPPWSPVVVVLTEGEGVKGEGLAKSTEGSNALEPTSSPTRTIHIREVEETVCDERQWHISRLPKVLKKACFALQAITKKKCTSLIVQNNHSTPAPTYIGMMDNYKKNRWRDFSFIFATMTLSVV